MKRILTLIMSILMLIFINGQAAYAGELFVKNKSTHYELNSAGPESSHQQFAKQSLKILRNDKGEEAAAIYNGNESLLLEYCDMPDKDEKGYAFAYHFYDPYTKKNYLASALPASKITAMTKFKEHIKNAVDFYVADKESSIKELGRAIHYLEDVNVPHHAANLVAVVTNHSKYEKYIDEDESKFFVTTSNAYDKYIHKSFEEFSTNIFDDCAKNAYSYKDIATSKNKKDWDKAAMPTLGFAQENIAALLYRFEKEVNK